MKKLRWLFMVLFMAGTVSAFAQYYSIANGNWNSNTTWSIVGFGGPAAASFPIAGDVVNIGGGFTVTITGAGANCATIDVTNGSLNVSNTITVSGATTIGSGGTLNISGTAGTKNFNGPVTISSGGIWTESVSEPINYAAGLTNSGTFTANSGNHNFTASQTITGNFNIPRFVVSGSGITVTNSGTITSNAQLTVTGANANLINNGTISAQPVTISTTSARITNNGTLTIDGTLAGAGTSSFPQIFQGASSVLNLNGTTPVGPTLTVTVSSSGTNTVNYGGGNQTVLNGSYSSLSLAGSGTKTFQAATVTISGNLTIGATAITTGASTTLNFSGTAQTISGTGSLSINNVQLSGSGAKTFSLPIVIGSTFAISSGTIGGFSNLYTYTANAITINGGAQAAGKYGSMAASSADYKTDAFFSGTGFIDIATGSHTYYSRASGNWMTPATWSTLGFSYSENFGTFPVAGETVNLGTNVTVTVTGTQAAGTLAFSAANTGTTTLDVTGASLTTGAISIPRPTSGTGSNILAVGTGILNASSISYTGTTGGVQRLTISTGSASVSGDVTSANTSGTIQFTGAGSMTVGGNMYAFNTGTLTTIAGCTFGYNGSSPQTVQTFTYRNLALSGAGAKSSTTGTTNLGISTVDAGNLSIADGTSFSIGNATYNIWGTTTVGNGSSGSLNFVTSTNGAKVFGGLVTIGAGATWDNAINENFSFSAGITNLGTLTPGTGTYTFNTNSQTITGVPSIPTLTASGTITLTINGTLTSDNLVISNANTSVVNNGNLTVNTSLSGLGSLTQNSSTTLTIGGTMTLTAATAIIATSSGNTVNYTGADQTVASGNYFHLNLAGSGTKTLQAGTTSIGGDFIASGSASITGVAGIAIAGNVTFGSSTTFSPSSFTYTVAGDWTSNGTLNGTGSTISFSGGSRNIYNSATTLFYNVIMGGTGTKTLTSPIAIDGNLSINSGVVVDLGTFTSHTSGTLTIAGVTQPIGTHGSDTPNPDPTYVNNTYFAPTVGFLSVNSLVYYVRQTGNWSDLNTWSTVSHTGGVAGTVPGVNDEVRIGGTGSSSTRTVTVTANATCKTLSFKDTGTEANNLNINSGITLTVTANITIQKSITGNTISNYLNVGAGTLNAGNIAFTNGVTSTSSNPHRIVVSTGTVNVTGNVTGTGISALIWYTGAGLLQLHGSIFTTSSSPFTAGTLTMDATSTIEYAGASQALRDASYTGHVTISGTGTKTWTMGAGRAVGGNLIINSGTALTTTGGALGVTGNATISGSLTTSAAITITGNATISGSITPGTTLAVSGSTTASGTLSMSGNSAKTFTGDVTLNNGSIWSVPSNSTATFGFAGNFTNNATTFTSGTGLYTFSGTSKALSGTSTGVIQNLAVIGSYTNNGVITVGTALSGSGTLTNGATGTLNIGGTVSTVALDATTNGNTVNYNGTGAQTVYTPASSQYQNLSFNNTTASGIATMPATINVGGNLTNNGAVAVGGFYGFNPNSGTVVLNGAAAQSIQGTASSSFNNLTSNSAVSVTALSAITVNGTLHALTGNFINSASLTMGNGATINRNASTTFTGSAPVTGVGPLGNYYHLIYSGSGSINTGPEAQGTHVKDVTIGLAGTLTQVNALDLYGILLVNSGATYDPGNELLTVKSWSDTGTDAGGSIGVISGTFSLTQRVVVERYFRAKDNTDRFFSSPVTNATVAQLQESFSVTGAFTGNSFPCTGCTTNGASLRWYKESVTGVINKGYQSYPATNNLATLTPGVGYDNYMWDGTTDETIRFRGPINQGNQNGIGTDGATGQVVSKTIVGAGTPTADGWNLIGNPYPAPIKWNGLTDNGGGWTRTNIALQAWAWDVYNGVWVSIDDTDDIAVGQAFWVQVTTAGNGTGTINITEAAKSSARSGAYYRERTDDPMLKLSLSNGSSEETAFITLKENATTEYSAANDFAKIELGIESMHMTLVKEGKHLGFYGYHSEMNQDIPVRIVTSEEREYELSVDFLGGFEGLTDYYLVDVLTQERLLVKPGLKYTFKYSKNHPEQRFMLSRGTDFALNIENKVSVYPNPTSGVVSVTVNSNEPVLQVLLVNGAGEVVRNIKPDGTRQYGPVDLSLEDCPNGLYLAKVVLESGVVIKRVIKH